MEKTLESRISAEPRVVAGVLRKPADFASWPGGPVETSSYALLLYKRQILMFSISIT